MRNTLAPDGFEVGLILANGAYPGPTIEGNLGDTFVIRVDNNISGPESGTALHWHGLFQRETPWMDGVPSVSMCPIAPGESFTYTFKADRAGTSWWHSHFSSQITAGLFGAMIIHDPEKQPSYDVDLGPILLNDFYNLGNRDMINKTVHNELAFSSNNMINGKTHLHSCVPVNDTISCSPNGDISKFRFESGKLHLLRLINAGTEALQHFTIDQHNLTIVALDYVPVEPIETSVVHLSPGQRADILVRPATRAQGSFWMRSDIDTACSAPLQPNALAAIYFEDADMEVLPQSVKTTYTKLGCATTALDESVPKTFQAPPNTSFTQPIEFTFRPNETGWIQFFTNDRQFRAEYGNPLLLKASTDLNFSAPVLADLFDFGSNHSVRMVFKNYFTGAHPMHLHGHDFWILAEGFGEWDGHITNYGNPMRRDTHQMVGMLGETPSYLVIEILLDNPGVWALHCHISQHLLLGMYMNVMYDVKAISGLVVPPEIIQGCTAWEDYASSTIVDQPDAGLRV
ncbi:multicopper oxidase [Lophiostoma macrostomum CBS 122681]|uniref:Multicopper oxidase n=1 Tax=Lophiostoma macrostomum CBS 122681 TaxID=1314788 RepID=A0A6A6TNZ2_9PLEO|nr:multicopper oxidase [Lophiostoma macrostomum CBS 122681]